MLNKARWSSGTDTQESIFQTCVWHLRIVESEILMHSGPFNTFSPSSGT
jgi:hypothetical protein